MTKRHSQWLAAGSLVVLAALLMPTSSAIRALACVPLLIAALLGVRAPPRWGLPVAILMLPYFSFGVMNALVDVGTRWNGVAAALAAIAVFMAGMDSLRRA